MLDPQITVKPELVVVGFEASFIHALSPDTTNFEVVGPLWNKFLEQADGVPNRAGGEMYGIITGRPVSERAHRDELEYLAGVAVRSTAEIPAGMVARTVPAGTFAVFTHRGPIEAIGETVHEIYRVWLPRSAYEHSDVADVELYDDRFHCEGDDSEMEYWISVRPKTLTE